MLDVAEVCVVIIGGGQVAVRKARGLIEAGAKNITVVSPEFDDAMPDTVNKVVGHYHAHHLKNAELVIAATNLPGVNEEVVMDCRARKIWVNRADSSEEVAGNFATPATSRDGAVVVTVSAGSPAITAKIRDQLSSTLNRKWVALANTMQSLRPKILAMNLPPEHRAQLLRSLATEEAADIAAAAGEEGLLQLIETIHLRK